MAFEPLESRQLMTAVPSITTAPSDPSGGAAEVAEDLLPVQIPELDFGTEWSTPLDHENLSLLPNRDYDVTYIERTPRFDYDAAQNNPEPGELVTFQGHIKRWGDSPADAVAYHWELDGVVVDSGVLTDLAPNEERVVTWSWNWQSDDHDLKLIVDPDNTSPETSEANNSLEIRTNGITVGFWVEQSIYDYFQEHQSELGIGSNSWEDWAQRQMAKWNEYNANAIYDISPEGVLDRVRIDKIVVVPDGALPLSGGLPSNHPDIGDKTVDLMWGFPANEQTFGLYTDTTSVSTHNPFYLEQSLLHELGHARYLIDNYGFDVGNTPDHDQVQILEDGQPVAGSPLMPILQWGQSLYYNENGGVMTGPYSGWSPYEAAALNLIAGDRAVCGNFNAPCNIGSFLDDLPQNNHVQFVDETGQMLAGADVRVFQATPGPGWYGKEFDTVPDLQFTTDAEGYAHMPQNPFSDGEIVHGFGHTNGVIVLRVEHGDRLWYRFMEVTDFNLQYWQGNTEDGDYTLEMPGSGFGIEGPEIRVLGSRSPIISGTEVADTNNQTDFGSAVVDEGTVSHVFAVKNDGPQHLQLTGQQRIEIVGPHAGDFRVTLEPTDSILPGFMGIFRIEFSPSEPGLREAQIRILSNDANEGEFTFAIEGVGIESPVTIVDVELDGSQWSPDFRQALGGDGYSLGPDGELSTLPWMGIDTIRMTFDQQLDIDLNDLVVEGGENTYQPIELIESAGAVPGTVVATWKFATPFEDGVFNIRADGIEPVSETSYRFAVLAGDANGDARIDAADYTVWSDNFGLPLDGNTIKADFNANGGVEAADYTIWSDQFGATLPEQSEPSEINQLLQEAKTNLALRHRDLRMWHLESQPRREAQPDVTDRAFEGEKELFRRGRLEMIDHIDAVYSAASQVAGGHRPQNTLQDDLGLPQRARIVDAVLGDADWDDDACLLVALG